MATFFFFSLLPSCVCCSTRIARWCRSTWLAFWTGRTPGSLWRTSGPCCWAPRRTLRASHQLFWNRRKRKSNRDRWVFLNGGSGDGEDHAELGGFPFIFFWKCVIQDFFSFFGWGGGFCCVCTAAPQQITCRRGPVAQTREYNGVK